MELPELVFGNEKGYIQTQREIADFFHHHQGQLSGVKTAAAGMRLTYRNLRHFFDDFTGPICSKCPEPCCVNRHGFPDFEDLVVFHAMGIKAPSFDCNVADTAPCQFLSPSGCLLPRQGRSYRCTWDFCNSCMDKFQQDEKWEFKKFQALMAQLARRRNSLLEQFEHQWFADIPG